MGYQIIKSSGKESAYMAELIADTTADLTSLPVYPEVSYGSNCFVIETSSVFMLNTKNEWKEV